MSQPTGPTPVEAAVWPFVATRRSIGTETL
jgi:hypothetical protein